MTTPNLTLTELANGQANWLNANEALAWIDALVQTPVISRSLTATPVSPVNGALYIMASAWAGVAGAATNSLALYRTGSGWLVKAPKEGWKFEDATDDLTYRFNGTAWVLYSTGGGGGAGGTTVAGVIAAGVLDLSAVVADTVLVTLNANVTSIILPAGASGVRKDLIIRFAQDGTGGRTVALGAFNWEGGTPPTINSAAGAVTYITASNPNNLGWDGFK